MRREEDGVKMGFGMMVVGESDDMKEEENESIATNNGMTKEGVRYL